MGVKHVLKKEDNAGHEGHLSPQLTSVRRTYLRVVGAKLIDGTELDQLLVDAGRKEKP